MEREVMVAIVKSMVDRMSLKSLEAASTRIMDIGAKAYLDELGLSDNKVCAWQSYRESEPEFDTRLDELEWCTDNRIVVLKYNPAGDIYEVQNRVYFSDSDDNGIGEFSGYIQWVRVISANESGDEYRIEVSIPYMGVTSYDVKVDPANREDCVVKALKAFFTSKQYMSWNKVRIY